jgi:hypothetical protein
MKIAIKKYIINIFLSWWRLPLLSIITSIISIFITLNNYRSIFWFAIWLETITIISLFLILIISIYYFLKYQIKKGLITFLLLIICIIINLIIYIIGGISLWAIGRDGFADDLKIPDNIQLTLPLAENDKTRLNSSSKHIFNNENEIYFDLRKSIQPGIYFYEIWMNFQKAGKIYLKAYEVSKNISLSSESLKKETLCKVKFSSDASELFFFSKEFFIFEGDWGKPYAARFEIWFISDSDINEIKIYEKNFKIEGWQR